MARTKQTNRIYRIQENEPGGTESQEEEEESESEEEEQAAAESTTHDQPHDGKYAWDAGMRQSGKLAAIGTGQYIFTSETGSSALMTAAEAEHAVQYQIDRQSAESTRVAPPSTSGGEILVPQTPDSENEDAMETDPAGDGTTTAPTAQLL